MNLLLHTHTLIWSMDNTSQLSSKALKALEDRNNEILVSVVSVWEASTKFRLGNFPEAAIFTSDPRGVLQRLGFADLPLSLKHAHLSGSMPHSHKEPFDRMLAAQALLDGLLLVSNDKVFDSMLVTRLW